MIKQRIDQMTDKQKTTTLLIIIISIVVIFLLFGGSELMELETFKTHKDTLLSYVKNNYWLMFLACGLIYTLSTALSLPGGIALSLMLGFLFGRWAGTLLIVISATIGASLIFLLARYLLADWAKQRLQQSNLAEKIINGFEADAFNYLLFLRLVPLFPFWLVNLAPAFTPVSTRIYVIATFIGIIPGSFVFANLGRSLSKIDNLNQLLSLETIIAFTLLGLLALAPVLVKRYKLNKLSN